MSGERASRWSDAGRIAVGRRTATPLVAWLLALGLAVGCATPGPADPEWVEFLTGTWGWVEGDNTCGRNPHAIVFSEDRTHMRVTQRKPILGARGVLESEFEYRIISTTGSDLRMQIVGETRLTDFGKLVVWDLRRTGPDTYCWHRTDWSRKACTGTVRRCT